MKKYLISTQLLYDYSGWFVDMTYLFIITACKMPYPCPIDDSNYKICEENVDLVVVPQIPGTINVIFLPRFSTLLGERNYVLLKHCCSPVTR